MSQRLIPAILSGGSGTRLWPLSTDQRPKQFHALASERTLIQHAAARMSDTDGLVIAGPILICSERHESMVESQLGALAPAPSALILEPFGRNTAPAAAIAALVAQEADPHALVLLMSADHRIGDGFPETVARASSAALDRIVVFGVQPTAPETGYGYIEVGGPLSDHVNEVVRFAEKPNLATAEAYLAGARHLWNAGIFLFAPTVLLAEMERHAPDVLVAARAALAAAKRNGVRIQLRPDSFAACPSISLDYAVMEKTDRAAVIPMGADWADIGSWSEVWRLGGKDASGNVAHGDSILIDAANNMIWSEDQTVAVVGVSDLIVVQTKDGVLVLPKSRAQDVKQLVEQLKARATTPGA